MFQLLVVVDGTESTIHDFGPPLPWHEEAKFTLSTLLIGDIIGGNDSKRSNFNTSLQCGYEIGNVFVFTGETRAHVRTDVYFYTHQQQYRYICLLSLYFSVWTRIRA